jgi:hypothetical protein
VQELPGARSAKGIVVSCGAEIAFSDALEWDRNVLHVDLEEMDLT